MKFNSDAAGSLGIIGGIAAIVYAAYQTHKMKNAANKLEMSLEDVAKRTPVDIQKAFLDKVVERAVDREVHKAVQNSAKFVTSQIQSDMDGLIRKDVNAAYADIRHDVEDRVTSAVNEIDVDALKADIREKVGNKMVNQLWNMSGIGKMLGQNESSGGLDLSGLKDVLSALPSWERADFLRKYMQK